MHQDRRIDLELLELGVLLHQNLFLVLHLAVLRDGGIVLQLSSDSHVVGVLVGVVEGPGHLAVIVLIAPFSYFAFSVSISVRTLGPRS